MNFNLLWFCFVTLQFSSIFPLTSFQTHLKSVIQRYLFITLSLDIKVSCRMTAKSESWSSEKFSATFCLIFLFSDVFHFLQRFSLVKTLQNIFKIFVLFVCFCRLKEKQTGSYLQTESNLFRFISARDESRETSPEKSHHIREQHHLQFNTTNTTGFYCLSRFLWTCVRIIILYKYRNMSRRFGPKASWNQPRNMNLCSIYWTNTCRFIQKQTHEHVWPLFISELQE